MARAYALQGDTAKARAAYQDFLVLWKDADPDITILKQARSELRCPALTLKCGLYNGQTDPQFSMYESTGRVSGNCRLLAYRF